MWSFVSSSLNLAFSRFTHGIACVGTLFPLPPLSGESTFFYTSSSADGHVNWLHFSSPANNSAVNICGQALERLFLFFFFSVTALFYLEDSRRIQDLKRREWRSAWGGRERERERKRERERERERACTWERDSKRKRFGSSFYIFFPPPGPALCKLGLTRSAVCSTWSLYSGPQTFLWPSFVLFSLAFPFLVF